MADEDVKDTKQNSGPCPEARSKGKVSDPLTSQKGLTKVTPLCCWNSSTAIFSRSWHRTMHPFSPSIRSLAGVKRLEDFLPPHKLRGGNLFWWLLSNGRGRVPHRRLVLSIPCHSFVAKPSNVSLSCHPFNLTFFGKDDQPVKLYSKCQQGQRG